MRPSGTPCSKSSEWPRWTSSSRKPSRDRSRLKAPLDLPPGQSEDRYLRDLRDVAGRNQQFRSYIGLGYSNCITPAVIQRNVLENPGWYTPYTPYQAEIAQGRLEGLLTFQTMVTDLTGMEIANASLLDEATAAAEAMTMCIGCRRDASRKRVAARCSGSPARAFRRRSRSCARGPSRSGSSCALASRSRLISAPDVFGVLVQYPGRRAARSSTFAASSKRHARRRRWSRRHRSARADADDAPRRARRRHRVGTSQRFGVPLGFGGPHAAFFATRRAFVRQMPGRIIGVSRDAHGQPRFRLALQTREQHIRREKATSNICTAQALLAIMAAMYAVYHGPDGLARSRGASARSRLLAARPRDRSASRS